MAIQNHLWLHIVGSLSSNYKLSPGPWGIHAIGTTYNTQPPCKLTFCRVTDSENMQKLVCCETHQPTCYTSGPFLNFFALARFLSCRRRSFGVLCFCALLDE